jgi:hypothetical protein
MTMTCELLPYLNYSWVVRRWKMFSFIVVRVVHDDSERKRRIYNLTYRILYLSLYSSRARAVHLFIKSVFASV